MNNGDSQNCYVMMNEPVDADKGKELMPAVEGCTMTEPSYQHKYPEPFAKYKDVVEDSKLFMDTLGKLHAAMGTKFMIPTIGGRELDLHQLFVEVTARGGIEKVIADRRWREVTAAFNFPSTATNASFVLRKYYMSLLHHYEKLYFFGSLGWSSPTTATSVPAERSAEAILQHSAKSISARKRRINGELTPPGPSASTARPIAGVIDGKFEYGYFVTVNVGAQKLRGVLFHTQEQSANRAAVFSGNADYSVEKVDRRRRRKKKLSKRDPSHPKPNRSGYNFFFQEQHARLKPLHPGRDRAISKIIGDLWNKLTDTEKSVYQEIGVKDKERYRSEMAVYKERLRTGQVISDAVPIQQLPAEPMEAEDYEGELLEVDEDGSSSDDDSSDFEGKNSDEEAELETSDVGRVATESTSLVADPSIEGDDFELRRRD